MKYVMMSVAVLAIMAAVAAGASFSGHAPPGVVAVNDAEGSSIEGGGCPTWECVPCKCGIGMCPGSMVWKDCDVVPLWRQCGNIPGKPPMVGPYCHVCTVAACAQYAPCYQPLQPCYP